MMPIFGYVSKEHLCFPKPDNTEVKLWRYMQLSKLVSMLHKCSLHFSRADMLGDRFEGTRVRNGLDLSQYFNEAQRKEMLRTDRSSVAASCWHMNEHESAAMWEMYSREGIAVQTTFSRLTGCLPRKPETGEHVDIYVGEVRYIDYDRDQFLLSNNFFSRFMHKRHSFMHEREVRALVHIVDPRALMARSEPEVENEYVGTDYICGVPEQGLDVPIDLNLLVEQIYVAPTTPAWFAQAVQAVVTRFGFSFPVHQSRMNEDPIY